jgi:hypothetical protein
MGLIEDAVRWLTSGSRTRRSVRKSVWSTEEEERPSPYGRTPVLLSLGSAALRPGRSVSLLVVVNKEPYNLARKRNEWRSVG